MGRRFAGLGPQGLNDLQALLVDHMHGILVGSRKNVHPGVGAVFVTAGKKARTQGRYFRHRLPGAQVDDRDFGLGQVRGGQQGAAVALPGDAGTQVRHAIQIQLGDALTDVEIDGLPLVAIPRGADQDLVALIEEEIIQKAIELGPAHREGAGLPGGPLLHPVIVHGAVIDRQGIVRDHDLPDLGDILEGGDEALPGGRGIDGAHPAGLAGFVLDRDQLDGQQVPGVQDHQVVGQVVGHGDIAAIAGHRQVAGVDAGADLGHRLKAVQIEFADPAVPGGEIDEAPVIGEFGPAMQGAAGGKAMEGFQAVAIQDGGMVIARLHHHEEIQRVGPMEGVIR